MRSIPDPIWEAFLTGGPFIGDRASNAYVTVEVDWHLTEENAALGTWPQNKRPVRWFQRADGSQFEVDIPNISTIDIDRNLDSDAATCTIRVYNQKMNPNLVVLPNADLGDPGHFTWSHGSTLESQARWGHQQNEWSAVLIPNAMLRTYEGYGGRGKTRENAQEDGNVVLTGVWLVDAVRVGTDGMLEMRCRDMAKLLIEQQMFPPLVPPSFPYPISYCRWVYDNQSITPTPLPAQPPPAGAGGTANATYETSSADAWYGFNATIHGHRGTDSMDGNLESFALSVGNSGPERPFCTDYFQYNTGGQQINSIYMYPWMGGYTMYISIMENGSWVDGGGGLIPYDFATLEASQPGSVDTGANIPFISQQAVPIEEGREYPLPRSFHADRIRITFRNHVRSPWGPWFYRCGIREISFKSVASGGAFGGPQFVQNYWSIANHPTLDGYWTVSRSGLVNNFGDAEHFGDDRLGGRIYLALTPTESGNGYFLVGSDGRVKVYGDAVHRGQATAAANEFFFALAETHNEQGYWLVSNLRIIGFGNAAGSMPSGGQQALMVSEGGATDVASHPSGLGGWLITFKGSVIAWGAASTFGAPITPHGDATAIIPTRNGLGYFVLDQFGDVHPRGNASNFGDVQANLDLGQYIYAYDMAAAPGDRGYWILDGGGRIYPRGEASDWGSPASGSSLLRDPGNYMDYSDIVKDLLLWSGWWLQDELSANQAPSVFGNIESTGIFSEECLPEDLFDKKPVIDGINAVKEIVGYLFYVDEEGGAHFECVDENTEILTKRGWLSHDRLVVGDETLAYDRESRTSYWESVDKVNRYVVEDQEMVELQSRSHSSLTTPNHRWWVEPASRARPGGSGRWRRSDELKYDDCIPVAAPYGDAPLEVVHEDAFVELVAWWITEGHADRGNSSSYICQSRVINPENCDRIQGCFEKLYGPPGRESGKGWNRKNFASRPRDYCWTFGHHILDDLEAVAKDRILSMDFLLSLSASQLIILIETAMSGDGHRQMVNEYGPYGRYTQSDLEAVRSLEIACVLAGINPRTTRSIKRDVYRTSYCKSTRIQPVAASRQSDGSATVRRVSYSGVVWCPTLRKNHVWLARRGGTVFFTGNSPNFWSPGNFYMDTGEHTDFIPEIDERVQMTEYSVEFNDESERSVIIISSEDPTADFADTKTTTFYPNNGYLLRGMIRPAMWVNHYFNSYEDQRLLAEMIALHIWFRERQGTLTCVANPAIQINDQVKIYERNTSESYVHYVRGIRTTNDRESGKYMMTLTTNWLGMPNNWVIRAGPKVIRTPSQNPPSYFFPASAALVEYVQNRAQSRSMDTVRLDWYGGGVDSDGNEFVPAVPLPDVTQPDGAAGG